MVKTVYGLIAELGSRSTTIAAMGLAAKVADGPLEGAVFKFANQSADLDRIAWGADALVTTGSSSVSEVETGLRQLIAARHFYGQFCERDAG